MIKVARGYLGCNLTLESEIDVEQGINLGPGKLDKKD